MSDPLLEAVQRFMEAVEVRLKAHRDEVRGMLDDIQTRSAPVEGQPGPTGPKGDKGDPGEASTVPGPKGDSGERGADGIATREEIEEIAQRAVAALDVRTFADIYHGVYKPDTDYTRGALATWDGSLWLAQVDTRSKPGDKGEDWKLIVKRGRDR